MEGHHLRGLWLCVEGCCNGPVWVTVETSVNGIMYLTKSFVRARCLGQGHLLHFKLIEADTLVVKFFGASGARLECCAESSSDSDTASSSEAEDDDDDDGTPSVKLEDDDDDGDDDGSDSS